LVRAETRRRPPFLRLVSLMSVEIQAIPRTMNAKLKERRMEAEIQTPDYLGTVQAEMAVLERKRGLVACYFDKVDGEARYLYQEFRETPPPTEVLERQREGVDRILPPPDAYTLEVTARVGY
jgi:hypothetical protein